MARLSSILVPPTLALPFGGVVSREVAERERNTINALVEAKRIRLDDTSILPGIELLAQVMVASCAHRIRVPTNVHNAWPVPSTVKKKLSPGLRRSLEFVDRRDAIWTALEQYWEPVNLDLGDDKENHEATFLFHQIFWELYLLVLGSRTRSQLVAAPTRTVLMCDKLLVATTLSAESRARLARVRGLFALFHQSSEIPGFICSPQPGVSFSERLDEILDDAYLLQASAIRAFIGFESNLASIKRDLRKLVRFIVRHQRWAKGLLGVASQNFYLPSSASQTVGTLHEILSGMNFDFSAPVYLDPNTRFAGPKVSILEALRVPFSEPRACSVRLRLLGPP